MNATNEEAQITQAELGGEEGTLTDTERAINLLDAAVRCLRAGDGSNEAPEYIADALHYLFNA